MQLRGVTVLLVEDDTDNLELLTTCLEAEGAVVLAAASLGSALAAAANRHIDVVVTDLELPDGDGWTLPGRLCERSGRESMPAVAISGYSEDHWRAQGRARVFEYYAVKPFAIANLVRWLVALSRGAAGDEPAA